MPASPRPSAGRDRIAGAPSSRRMALTALGGPALLEALRASGSSAGGAPGLRRDPVGAEDRLARRTRSPGRSRKDNPPIADGADAREGRDAAALQLRGLHRPGR